MRRWRKMTWVLWAWCILVIVWAVAGAASSSSSCNGHNSAGTLARHACNTGTGIGVAIIIVIGFFGFVFFSLIWFMTRPREPRVGA